jgi:hypothetical protein
MMSKVTTKAEAPDEMSEFTDEPHRWSIEPHPSRDFDVLVTNSDTEAIHWIHDIAESHLWDTNEGEERTMRVTMNPAIVNTPSDFDRAADLAPAGELVSRSEALAATMRIGCPSSYCVCSVQIADAIRALPSVARVPVEKEE